MTDESPDVRFLHHGHFPQEPQGDHLFGPVQAETPTAAAPAGCDPRPPEVRGLRRPDALQDQLARAGGLPVSADVQPEVRVHPEELVPRRTKPGCDHPRGTWCACVKTWTKPTCDGKTPIPHAQIGGKTCHMCGRKFEDPT